MSPDELTGATTRGNFGLKDLQLPGITDLLTVGLMCGMPDL